MAAVLSNRKSGSEGSQGAITSTTWHTARSHITICSVHPVKIVTTGEGGRALTHDAEVAKLMQLDRSHGITRDADMMEESDPGAWYYEQHRLGYNYRMTDINAALGLSQLDRLAEFIDRRRVIARRYDEAFAGLPVTTPWQLPEANSAWHLYVIRVDPAHHRVIFDELRAGGILVNLHYMPVYLQPYYRKLGFEPGLCPNSESYYAEAFSLPMFPTLSGEQQDQVIEAVRKAVSR